MELALAILARTQGLGLADTAFISSSFNLISSLMSVHNYFETHATLTPSQLNQKNTLYDYVDPLIQKVTTTLQKGYIYYRVNVPYNH